MKTDKLYRVQEKDLDKLKQILSVCFANDPLYKELIQDPQTRERLLPELFSSDLTEYFETCDIFSDSEELNSILILSDETEHINPIYQYLASLRGTLRMEGSIIREDPSLQTFRNFIVGKDYLNESWVSQLHQTRRIHIIYLAVAPDHQHRGLADFLMQTVLNFADEHGLMISLDTHNPANVPFYEHLGFHLFGVIERPHFNLKQYCMIRDIPARSQEE